MRVVRLFRTILCILLTIITWPIVTVFLMLVLFVTIVTIHGDITDCFLSPKQIYYFFKNGINTIFTESIRFFKNEIN